MSLPLTKRASSCDVTSSYQFNLRNMAGVLQQARFAYTVCVPKVTVDFGDHVV